MGVVEKMKRLHKQKSLELSDIGRVVVAEEAGVDSPYYLRMARTLADYIKPGFTTTTGTELLWGDGTSVLWEDESVVAL